MFSKNGLSCDESVAVRETTNVKIGEVNNITVTDLAP